MKMKYLLFFIIQISFFGIIKGQVLTVNPSLPTVDSTVTIIFDASQGNSALKGYTGDVYMHTGVITLESTSSSDWKYVKTKWGDNTAETKMTALGNNLYQSKFNIKSFYAIPDSETVLKMAFVFRNADCSLVGRNQDGSDILYSLKYNYSKSKYQSYTLKNDSLTIICSDGEIIITPYNTNILNIFSTKIGQKKQASYTTIGIKQLTSTNFRDLGKKLIFTTDSIELVIDTSNLSFKFVYQKDTILNSPKIYNFSQKGNIITSIGAKEKIYGTGSRAIDLDRCGRTLAINNQAHYGYSWGAENLNITLPILTSSKRYALYFDNHSIANLDIGSTDAQILSYSYSSGQANIFFIAGNNYKQITRQLTYLTGNQPIPPIWALGYIQSKYGYKTETEAKNIVNQIKNAGFPLDALVLDLYWFGNQSTMGNLNWDFSRFPNPETMISDFRNLGVKTILISEPYFTLASSNYAFADSNNYFTKNSSGKSYILNNFWAGKASLLDIFNPAAQNWMWQFYHDRTSEGVEGWWTDLGEPESHPSDMIHFNNQTSAQVHNIFALEWEKMIYENWKIDFPQKRLFNLSRSGFIGMQRYSTFPWSGDISRSFEGLKAQIPIMLSMGLCGIGYMHSDNGGFVGGGYNEELFIRWIQMGVFSPIFRIHGTGIETSPTAYNSATQNIVRKYIKLRYKLLPYNYTLSYENSENGTPLARPMDFYDPQNINLQNINDQYFWGNNFIIAPILNQGQRQRTVILPKGKWIEYHSLQEYTGPGKFPLSAPLSNIPILVRAGSFIPTARNLTSTEDYNAKNIFVQYFPDDDTPNSQYTMYDDDKHSPKSLIDSNYELIKFKGNFSESNTTITINNSGLGYLGIPTKRQFIFEIFRMNLIPTGVTIDNSLIAQYNSLDELLNNQSGYYEDRTNQKLYVNVPFYDNKTIINLFDFHVNTKEIASKISQFYVYPNPGNNYFFVESNTKDIENTEIYIYSTSGVMIKKIEMQSQRRNKINTEDLDAGIYFIKIQNKTSVSNIKWVKNEENK